jgi:DNA-binding MarR family transcriptional regulator
MRYCNIYAGVYKKEMTHGTNVSFSYAQIQVLEYLLENEELNQNMSCIATRLGITFSTFSKVVNKL